MRKPLMDNWEYEVAGTGTFITLAGHRPDQPAALPLVTSSGRSEAEAVENLKEKAREWDRHAMQ